MTLVEHRQLIHYGGSRLADQQVVHAIGYNPDFTNCLRTSKLSTNFRSIGPTVCHMYGSSETFRSMRHFFAEHGKNMNE
eukprot:4226013-Karenia_brevis.AAC.1